MLIVSLDQYIVVVALPDIGQGLGYSAQTLQAVISAYAVASAGFLLLGGRASDLLGRRRVLVSGLALYAGGSLAGGLAPAPEVLLGARAVQGLGGALVFPATLALINTTLRPLARRQPPSLGTAAAADLLELTRADAMLGQPGGHPLIEAASDSAWSLALRVTRAAALPAAIPPWPHSCCWATTWVRRLEKARNRFGSCSPSISAAPVRWSTGRQRTSNRRVSSTRRAA